MLFIHCSVYIYSLPDFNCLKSQISQIHIKVIDHAYRMNEFSRFFSQLWTNIHKFCTHYQNLSSVIKNVQKVWPQCKGKGYRIQNITQTLELFGAAE